MQAVGRNMSKQSARRVGQLIVDVDEANPFSSGDCRDSIGRGRGPADGDPLVSANGLLHLGTQALGADAHRLHDTIDQHSLALDVDVPPSIGHSMRVTDVVSETGLLVAQIATSGHDWAPSENSLARQLTGQRAMTRRYGEES